VNFGATSGACFSSSVRLAITLSDNGFLWSRYKRWSFSVSGTRSHLCFACCTLVMIRVGVVPFACFSASNSNKFPTKSVVSPIADAIDPRSFDGLACSSFFACGSFWADDSGAAFAGSAPFPPTSDFCGTFLAAFGSLSRCRWCSTSINISCIAR